jgi:hypothetical protein
MRGSLQGERRTDRRRLIIDNSVIDASPFSGLFPGHIKNYELFQGGREIAVGHIVESTPGSPQGATNLASEYQAAGVDVIHQ